MSYLVWNDIRLRIGQRRNTSFWCGIFNIWCSTLWYEFRNVENGVLIDLSSRFPTVPQRISSIDHRQLCGRKGYDALQERIETTNMRTRQEIGFADSRDQNPYLTNQNSPIYANLLSPSIIAYLHCKPPLPMCLWSGYSRSRWETLRSVRHGRVLNSLVVNGSGASLKKNERPRAAKCA